MHRAKSNTPTKRKQSDTLKKYAVRKTKERESKRKGEKQSAFYSKISGMENKIPTTTPTTT